METEKVVAVLLIIAILFSVATIVFNLTASDLRPVNTTSGHVVKQPPAGGIELLVEGPANGGSGK